MQRMASDLHVTLRTPIRQLEINAIDQKVHAVGGDVEFVGVDCGEFGAGGLTTSATVDAGHGWKSRQRRRRLLQ